MSDETPTASRGGLAVLKLYGREHFAMLGHTARRRRDPLPVRHGTVGGYTNRRCRCADCTAAHTVWHRAWRARGRTRGQ